MKNLPLVSIVIPAYNPTFFRKTLHSALNQDYGNLEVIVCDDSREGKIQAIYESFVGLGSVSLRYVKNPSRLGFVGNLLQCLKQCKGSYIKFLCDDDQLFPACISQQVQQFIDHDDLTLVVAQRFLWDANDIQLPARIENTPLSSVSSLFKGSDLLPIIQSYPSNFLGGLSSALMRKSDLSELLPALANAQPSFVALLDLALYTCLLRRGNMVVLNDVLIVERLYPERLGVQQFMLDEIPTERELMGEMVAGGSHEEAPARGWVRYVKLADAMQSPREWEEWPLGRSLGSLWSSLPERVGSSSQSFSEFYAQWLACRNLSPAQRRLLPETVSRWPRQPKIVPVIIDQGGSTARLNTTMKSLATQVYPAELVLLLSVSCKEVALEGNVFKVPLQGDGIAQLNELLPQLAGADWFYLLRPGDRLVASALLMLAERIAMNAQLRCIYSDEGGLVEGESAAPVFKPDFNLDLLCGYPYVGRCLAFHRQYFIDLGAFNPEFGEMAPHDLLWRVLEADGTAAIKHIADILPECQFGFGDWLALPEVAKQNPRVVQAHLQRSGVAHQLRADHVGFANRIDYLHADKPLVSIVIVHKDQLAALQRCIDSLMDKTAYTHYEVLIVDQMSEQPETQEWLRTMATVGGNKLRVISFDGTAQPGSATARNYSVAHARGEYLLFVTPYAVVTRADWLGELLHHAQRPEVGVVGAKLHNSQGLILHAGVILGMEGTAGYPFYGEDMNASGYMHRLQVVQNFSAVGADCLMVRKDVYLQAGSLDESTFTQAFGEVDLCLRIREEGYLVVWNPFAELALGTRPPVGQDGNRLVEEVALFYDKWLPLMAGDPAYNPNLMLLRGNYRLEPGLRTGWSPFEHRQLPNVLLLPMNASAVGHYRMTQPFIELENAARVVGQISYESLSVIDLERRSPDVAVFQGRYTAFGIEEISWAKRYMNTRRIYELDDYIINVPAKNGHMRNMPTEQDMERILRTGVELCDRVVASTYALADTMSSMHSDIRVAPNMLTPSLWDNFRPQRRTSAKPRVGWGGGTSHTGDLEVIAEVVRELANEVEWVFFGMCPDALRPYIHEFHPVIGMAEYPAKLASLNLDLALAPLEFHLFNDCKSNLRQLEYGACGYPVICTNTKAYDNYLPSTRIMTNSTQEWLEAIRMHLADPDASYQMGDELREIVLRDFTLRGNNLLNWVNCWLAD